MHEGDRGPLESWNTGDDGQPQSPQVQYAEDFLSTPAAQSGTEGKDVLVFGGGDTAAWCTEAARAQGAGAVTWAARPAKPKSTEPDPDNPGRMRETEFGQMERDIKKAVEMGQEVPAELSQKYRDELHQHAERLLDQASHIDRQIQTMRAAGGDELEIRKKEEERDGLRLDAAPHSVAKERNKDINAGTDPNDQIALDVLMVEPAEGGKVKVTFADGTFRVVDKIVGAMGQDKGDQNGPIELVKKVPELVPIFEGDPPMPVGLQSPGGEVRVLGASAWQCMDKIKDPEQRQAYRDAIRDRSLRDVSPNSRGVVFGFEAMGDNSARANDVLAEQIASRPGGAGGGGGGDAPPGPPPPQIAEAAESIAREHPGAATATGPAPPPPLSPAPAPRTDAEPGPTHPPS
jgi:hypothetical protein